jgi:hypothetical protein
MMKRLLFLCLNLLFFFSSRAQIPEDALRMSYFRPTGTARTQAIGGAMGSIGGDVTANYVNPAGLGFFKTGDAVVSPGWAFNSANASYLSNNSKGTTSNKFNLGTSGFVFGKATDEKNSFAISVAVSQTADFKGHISYQGKNNYSSASDAYVDEFNASGYTDPNAAIQDPNLTYGTRMALYTYLIDTSLAGTGPTFSAPGGVLASGGELGQTTNINSTGGITEIAIGLAGSSNEKWYYGLSIGIPIVSYSRTMDYTETDLSGNPDNNFASYTHSETYSFNGVGVNGRLGAIYRPNLNWRIGLAVHTPSFYSINDRYTASMISNTEAYHGIGTVNSETLDNLNGVKNTLDYNLQTPWHFVVSGSYIFPGEVISGKMGFITADIEYVAYSGSRYSFPLDNNGNEVDNSYWTPLNNTIKTYYRNTFNFKLGGEYKADDIAFRLGGSYALNPYTAPQLHADQITIGGGVGYRKKGVFIDLTYVEGIISDVNFPYRLTGKDNIYASVKQYTGNLILSFGIKF